MTSKKSKQVRLDESRLKIAAALSDVDPRDSSVTPPPGAVMADQSELSHNNTYDRLPLFYVDKVLTCRDCSKRELWTGEQQKWWYETAKGNINSTAVHCRACRDKRKAVRDTARKASENGLLKKKSQQ